MKRRTRPGLRSFARVLLFVLPLLLAAAVAFARLGGGETYSGGSNSSGGGWSGGGSNSGSDALTFELIFDLFRLLIWLHQVALPVALILDILIIWGLYTWFHTNTGAIYTASPRLNRTTAQTPIIRSGPSPTSHQRIDALRASDPNFSEILFRDFCATLFTQLHHARGIRKLDDYLDYISPAAAQALKTETPNISKVEGVVIGAMILQEVSPPDAEKTAITLRFEANYTETTGTARQSWYAKERWTLTRKKGVQSREPANIRVIACPNCGAPSAKAADGSCPSCRKIIRSGDFDWYLEKIEIDRETRPPLLTEDTPEMGTDLPTLYDPELQPALKAYAAAHPEFDQVKLMGRFGRTFQALQKAWTERNWEKARPFETDNLFQSHYYWMAEYRKQKLINVLDQVTLSGMVPVKLHEDRFYTSLTVRAFASMIDYVKTEDGKIVRGSTGSRRAFTEYWTFIKGRTARPPKGDGETSCPQCGAPLKISMAGVCEYCQSKISSGNFDWVLSEIEQDEAYVG